MMLLLQILAFLFAYVNARHNAPAVDAFRRFRSNGTDQRRFHTYNLYIRALFVLSLALIAYQHKGLLVAIMVAVMCTAIVWPVFNIVLNVKRDGGFKWWHLGSSQIDQYFKKKFGDKKGGIVLTLACAIVVVAVNILLFIF